MRSVLITAATVMIATFLLTGYAVFVVATRVVESPAAPEKRDWRPPLHLCPEEIELWDCVANARYVREAKE